ncbi:unnamed protein product, partial [Candidula unifasciata]
TYLDTATNTSAQDLDRVISTFPSFRLSPVPLRAGYLSFAGDLVGYSRMAIGRFLTDINFRTGMQGGPVVIFDNTSNAVVISPLSQFMAASSYIQRGQQIGWGIMGMVNDVPRGYSVDFIVYYSNQGINQAMQGWGDYLTRLYQKSTTPRDNDLTVQYLGYYTNNGAYYYYNTEQGKNYESTITDLADYIDNISVPFKYLEFDSWWYLKGKHDGTKTWEPQSDIFPHGFQYIYNRTKLPIGCHNRFWDVDTTYAKYNGGAYNFIPDRQSGFSVPDDYNFWEDIFNKTQTWGKFILYEQDWLNRETDKNAVLHSDLFVGRRWLSQMGKAAENYGITIQYCLSYPRHILQSLEIPSVTQARVTRDYEPGGRRQWNTGITSIFADAVNLAPFKDTFWTTESQPGNPYNRTEPNTRMEAILATLSTGPVGPGDGIGYINKTLLMKCCDATGRILKPDKPVKAIDDQIKMAAFKSPYPGPIGEVYTSYTRISGFFFGIIVVPELNNSYSLTPAAAWPIIEFPTSLAFSENDPKTLFNFSNTTPLKLGKECTVTNACLFYTSPLIQLSSGDTIVLLGELEKWVPISGKRVNSIQQTDGDVLVHVLVQAQESVTFTYYSVTRNQLKTVLCDNSKSWSPAENSVISLVSGICTLG